MRAAHHGVAALESQYQEAWWAWFPEFRIRSVATGIPPQGEGFDYWAFYSRTDVDLFMPLYTFGKISAAKRMATAGVNVAKQMQRLARAELTFQVTRAWHGIMLASELNALIEDGDEKLRKAREKLEEMEEEDHEDFDQADMFKLRIYEARVQRLVLDNETLARMSETGLRVAMGLGEGAALRLPKEKVLAPIEVQILELKTYVDLAVRHRPALAAKRHRVEVEVAAVERRWAEFFPDFFLAGSFSVAKTTPVPGEDEVKGTPFENVTFDAIGGGAAIGLQLTLDYPRKVARYNKAKADLGRARAELEVDKALLRVELERIWRDADSCQRLLRANERAMKASRSLLTLKAHEYENGVDDSVKFDEVLNAAVAYLGQKAEWLRSVHTFNSGVARLSQAVGTDITKIPSDGSK